MSLAVPVPALDGVLGRPRRAALDAFLGVGWRPYATPIGLDAERRRLLNIDLSDPDVAWYDGGALAAVAHVEIVGAEPADPLRVALALAGELPSPRTGGGAEAREWVWGPESGARIEVAGEPVRLWMCAERAYGDRLWVVASLVRHG